MNRLILLKASGFTASAFLFTHSSSCCEENVNHSNYQKLHSMIPVVRHPTTQWDNNWDGRQEKSHPNSKIVHQVILIRHGQYHQTSEKTSTEENKLTGYLTERGEKQATITGKRLDALFRDDILHKPHSVYFSTMPRATQTWQIIREQLKSPDILPPEHRIEPCSMIREVVPFKPIPDEGWNVRDEIFFKNQQRAEAAFLNYFHRPDVSTDKSHSTLLVCHGNMIRYLVCRALQLPPETWKRIAVWNASITVLEMYSDGRVSLRFFTDIGHLPTDLVTYG